MEERCSNKWVEIDVDAILHNLQEVRSILNGGTRLIAVIKANAYGHGATQMAMTLEKHGVDFFAVTFLEEALNLRQAGIRADIMLLSPLITHEQIEAAVQQDIILSITSDADANLLQETVVELKKPARVHIKIDTGLGRFGLLKDEVIDVCLGLQQDEYVDLQGIYTHMAEGGNSAYTDRQFVLFSDIVETLRTNGVQFKLKHCANSSVTLLYPHMHLNAVRIGTLLTGYHPVGVKKPVLQLQDPMKLKCRIISIRRLPRGSYLGYFRTYRLRRDACVAVIPVGYIDGFALEVGNRPAGMIDWLKTVIKMVLTYLGISRFSRTVTIGGRSYPVKGKIFMQMALLEIPPDAPVRRGDEAEITVRKTLVSSALPRIYATRDHSAHRQSSR